MTEEKTYWIIRDAVAATIEELPPHAYPPHVIECVIETFLRKLPKSFLPELRKNLYSALVDIYKDKNKMT